MAAGASSGVDVVTAGSAACADSETGRFENSATGTRSAGERELASTEPLDLPQLQGAYHEAYRTDDALIMTFWVRFAPDFHSADWSGLVRHDELERLAVRGREENCGN